MKLSVYLSEAVFRRCSVKICIEEIKKTFSTILTTLLKKNSITSISSKFLDIFQIEYSIEQLWMALNKTSIPVSSQENTCNSMLFL